MPEVNLQVPNIPAGAAGTPSRPEWLPEKFSNADGTAKTEELAKAYLELERKLGSAAPAGTPEGTPPATPKVDAATAGKAGLDLSTIASELLSTGALSQDTTAKLKAAGVSEADISVYAEGIKAQAAKVVNAFTEIAGGSDELRAVYAWTAANLSAEERQAYDGIMDAGDLGASKMAFEGLLARYRAANGSAGRLVRGGSAPASAGPAPFQSNAEVIAAMSDPRYRNGDESYHKEVQARLAASEFLQVRVGKKGLRR